MLRSEANDGESLENPMESISRAESICLASVGRHGDAIQVNLKWLQDVRLCAACPRNEDYRTL